MKQYFTKILKVPCKQLETQPKGSSCNKNNSCTFPKCKEKLFLCSRDNPDEPIGMINPKDDWVREGDEFSEDEIHRAFVGDKLKTGTVQIKCRCCGKYSSL